VNPTALFLEGKHSWHPEFLHGVKPTWKQYLDEALANDEV